MASIYKIATKLLCAYTPCQHFIFKSHLTNITFTTYIVKQQASIHNMQVIAHMNVFVCKLNEMFTELLWARGSVAHM